jgi:hypothetical protein
MKTTRALTIVTLLTGFLVACGDMPTSVPAPDAATLRFDNGGLIGTGGNLVVSSDSLDSGTNEVVVDGGEEDEQDVGGEESRNGGLIGTGGN